MSRKNQLAVTLGLIVSVVFLLLAFRNLHLDAFLANLKNIQPLWLLIAGLVFFVSMLVIALRWQFLLRAIQHIPLLALNGIVAVGYMGNNIYPLRAGEALRIYLLRRNHAVPVAKATTTVIIERVFDGLVMLTFIVVSVPLIDIPSEEIRRMTTLAALIFLPALGVFFVLAARPNLLRRLLLLASRLLPGRPGELMVALGEEVIHGLEGLRSPLNLAGAVISSYVTWGIQVILYWMVMFAFGLELGYPAALLAVGTVNLAGLIPASPGQLGVFEFFVSTVMIAAGVSRDTALAYAIVVHVVIWLPVTLVGFVILARQGLGWKAVTRARELEQSAVR